MALEKKQQVLEALSPVVKKRRLEKSKEKCQPDILMEVQNDNGERISDDLLQFQLYGLMFAGSHSSAAEQDAIKMGKMSSEDPLSWMDIVNMPFTSAVTSILP
ncbi:hypothetical protein O6H91_03G080900 [Diphasiastrum complanatum]|uniref:Uncharacterized protein n=1 Tax=Diphasiastrum complanatum TaxID=34168 RepID=A0ACC2E8K5_DIPCM|nr:hypothetical protein O6H91_03G080900 [Diphasiastrum complanatum]